MENPKAKSTTYVDPSSYTEVPDDTHTVLCEWWHLDRKYKGWFDPNELEPADGEP